MNKRKFAFIASLLSVVGLLAGSAHAATKYTTMTDLKGGSDTSHSSETSWGNVFGDGGGISNGTLTVKFKTDSWGTFGSGLNVTIGKNGILTATPGKADNKSCELNINGKAVVTLDGGTFINENSRKNTGNQISDGMLRIIHGGVFKSTKNRVQVGPAGANDVGILSVDDGTVEIGGTSADQQLTVGGNNYDGDTDGPSTGIVAMTNGTLTAYAIMLGHNSENNTAQLTFKDSDLTVRTIYKSKKVTEASYFIFDGTTVNTAAASQNILADLGFAYQLEGKGVAVNTKHSGTTVGGSFAGVGPFIKKGAETLTFKGKFTDSADLRVEEGVFAIDSTATLPEADKIALTISGTGAFDGLGQSGTYKSLTLGEDAVLPVAFENGAATTFKAAETIVTATADHPVTIAGTGTLTVNTVIAEGLTVTDASLFTLSGVAGSLKIEDGKLIAVKPSRPVDTLTWAKGSAGNNWSGTDNWTYGDPAAATTFQDGDTAVFATAGDKAVVDADVTAAKVEFTADATVTGTGTATLTTTNITVGADVTATIAVPLSEDIEKTGEGELVLQDYADGKALDLKGGAITLAWSDAAKENPISTEVDANAIAGVLDFGGAKQTLAGNVQNNSGIFRNGGEVRHGEIEVDPSSWLNLNGITDFTVGEGANVYFKRYATNTDGTRNRGQLNMYNAYLRIAGEGARFAVMNERTTQDGSEYNSYGKIGSSGGDATVEVGNGGTFAHEKRCLILGWDHGITGAIVGDGGNVTVGEQDIFLGYEGAAVLALTNSTLTAKSIKFGWSGKTPGKQSVKLVNSTVTIGQIGMNQALADGSSVVFDGATIVDNHGATALLQVLGIPYTIAEGGLTVKVADLDPKKEEDYVSFPGTFEGEGDFILVAAGKTPREARFSGEAEKGFTGNVVVSNGVTVAAEGKTFKGGLYACEGSTLNVATSVFEGNVTIEAGVKFTDVPDPTAELSKPVVLLQTKGTITSPLLDRKDPLTKNRYYVRMRGEIKELCYGRKPGTMIIIN